MRDKSVSVQWRIEKDYWGETCTYQSLMFQSESKLKFVETTEVYTQATVYTDDAVHHRQAVYKLCWQQR